MASHILVIQNGKYKGRKVRLSDSETIVGRGEGSKIRIASGEVSREHCVLIAQNDGVLVRELGSRNGTFLNGKPIAGEQLLAPGGTLTVGPMTFQLEGDLATSSGAGHPATGLRRAPKGDPGLSDDDIADLLANEEKPADASALHDTTVVPTGKPEEGTAEIAAPTPPPGATGRRRDFKNVSEEAADIIRRHLEMVSQKKAGTKKSLAK